MEWNGTPDKRRELAILIDRFAAVRLWLGESDNCRCILLEDLESTAQLLLTPSDLLHLIRDRSEDQRLAGNVADVVACGPDPKSVRPGSRSGLP
jgi:hypothetical protein